MLETLEPFTILLISMDTALGAARRERLNFPYHHRVVGVSGDDTPEPFRSKFRFLPSISDRTRRGYLGCFWAHRCALEAIVLLNLHHAVIVEDDASLKRSMPTPEELGDQPVALEGALTTPGVWHRASKEFGSSQRMACWKSLRQGTNDIDPSVFTLLGTGALYLPDAEHAQEILNIMDGALRLKAIDFFYREHRVFGRLYFPNPFACDDLEASEIHGPEVRDLYLGHVKDRARALKILKCPGPTPAASTHVKPLQFLHVTKCGGSSIVSWGRKRGFRWGAFFAGKTGELRSPHENLLKSERHHVPPCFFLKNPYELCEVFAVVRDPLARAISEFRCPWKGLCAPARSEKARSKRLGATSSDLNAWLLDKHMKGAMEAPFKNCHFLPQATYLLDDNDQLMLPSNRVLVFERLEEDFARMCEELHLPSGTLPHKNSSEMSCFTIEDLTQEVKTMLRHVYARDIALHARISEIKGVHFF
jgi:hypothetical protein